MKIKSDELQTFIAIVDTGSFTGAAEQMNQTSSGISRSLTRLEKKVNATLLRRTTRRIQLTDEGQTFLNQARQIINSMALAEESISGPGKNPSGLLRVDSASPFILHSIVPHIEEFTRLYPDLKLDLVSSERTIDLLERKVDVAIRIGALQDSTLHARSLGSSRVRILASPGYLKKYGTPKTIEDLQKHRLLGFTAPKELNYWPLKNKNEKLLLINPHVSASSGETLLQLARNHTGIVALSDFMTKMDLADGSLVQILKSQTSELLQPINAVYYKDTPSKKIYLFVEFLRKKMAFHAKSPL